MLAKGSSIPMLSNDVFYDATYVCYIHVCLQKKSLHLKIGFENAALPVANPHSQVNNSQPQRYIFIEWEY